MSLAGTVTWYTAGIYIRRSGTLIRPSRSKSDPRQIQSFITFTLRILRHLSKVLSMFSTEYIAPIHRTLYRLCKSLQLREICLFILVYNSEPDQQPTTSTIFCKRCQPLPITPIVDVFMIFRVRLVLCDLCSHLSLISI